MICDSKSTFGMNSHLQCRAPGFVLCYLLVSEHHRAACLISQVSSPMMGHSTDCKDESTVDVSCNCLASWWGRLTNSLPRRAARSDSGSNEERNFFSTTDCIATTRIEQCLLGQENNNHFLPGSFSMKKFSTVSVLPHTGLCHVSSARMHACSLNKRKIEGESRRQGECGVAFQMTWIPCTQNKSLDKSNSSYQSWSSNIANLCITLARSGGYWAA